MSKIATSEKPNLRAEEYPSKIMSIINPQCYALQRPRHAACNWWGAGFGVNRVWRWITRPPPAVSRHVHKAT